MQPPPILTPDQRLRVFVSSTLQELADERQVARAAIVGLRLSPVLFELGARPHPPRELYRAYLQQSHIFVGLYWQHYGWVAPDEEVSGLEDEYRLCGDKPKLIYVKTPALERAARLEALLQRIQNDDQVSYRPFSNPQELRELLENDLALLLTERFAASLTPTKSPEAAPEPATAPRLPLPLLPTPLIGRAPERAEVVRLLQRAEVRLVTLVGPGGVGKSRLGLEAARLLEPNLQDGVVFVALSAVSDPALLTAAIAGATSVAEAAGQPLAETLKTYLWGKQLLLLLDNFEQLDAPRRF